MVDVPRIIPDRPYDPEVEAKVTRSWTAKDPVTGRLIAKGEAASSLLHLEVASKELSLSHDQWKGVRAIGTAWERTWEE